MRRTASALVGMVLVLLTLGIVMLASTSSVRGMARFDDSQYFLKRQLVWLLISCLAGGIILRFDYHYWRKLALGLTIVSVILLVLVLKVGARIGGSYRWLKIGPFSFQPSELAKFGVVVALSVWMTSVGRRSERLREGLLFPAAGLGVILGLLMLEPDFGTTLLVGTVGMAMMYAGGTRLGHLAVAGVLGASAFALAVMRDAERMGRILAFLMPDRYPQEAHQLFQSRIAFIKGQLFGVGLGNSLQKQFYLPEAHNDFILAIVGEELGFLATGGVLLLFMGILVCGLHISLKAPDPFGRLLAFGLTMMIVVQAALNIGVVTGCLPTKGMPLPFISYGGSSLLFSTVCVCVLLNIAWHGDERHMDEHVRVVRDRSHRF